MNRFYKNRTDPRPLRSVNIRKQLIPHKNCPVRFCLDHLTGFFVILHSRFMGIFYKISLYGPGKRLYAGFLVVGYKTVSKPDPPQLFKQFPCPFICRCAVRDNGIINIKKKPSVSSL